MEASDTDQNEAPQSDPNTAPATPKSSRRKQFQHQPSSPFEADAEAVDYVYTDVVLSDEEGLFIDEDDEEEEDLSDALEDDIEQEEALKTPHLSVAPTSLPPPPVDDGIEADDEGDFDDALKSQTSPRSQSKQISALMIEEKPWRKSHSHRARSPIKRSDSSSQGGSRPLFRYIRSWGTRQSSESDVMPTSESITPNTSQRLEALDGSAPNEENAPDYTSDEDLYEDNESRSDSWDEDGVEWHDVVDFEQMPVIPTSFVVGSNGTPSYIEPVTQQDVDRLVEEECLLLKAVFQLLTERDQVGVEGDLHQADNILKKGPLKKQSFQVGRRQLATSTKWKVKYVEIRRGNLCYYEDSGQGRKTIHLRQSDTVVQATPSKAGFVFALAVQGNPARYWMTETEEERQAWIVAIKAAMIGDDDYFRELDLTPHQEALEMFEKLRNKVRQADTLGIYRQAIDSTLQDVASLQVPVQWVREQMPNCGQQQETLDKAQNNMHQAPQRRLKTSIADFWKHMREITFSINGVTVPRESPLASERILGALTRCILEFDKAWQAENAGQMSELQAISYARNILRAVLKSRERQDAACAVRHLMTNADLVEIVPLNQDDTVHMEVSFPGEDIRDDLYEAADEQTGWLWIKRRHSIGWKKRFCCLSGAVLSYYEASSPRPHGLRGQLVLGGSTVHPDETAAEGEERRFVLCITTNNQERLLAFEQETDFVAWKEAIEAAIDSVRPAPIDEPSTPIADKPSHRHSKSLLKGAERVIKGADGSLRGTVRVIKGATGGATRVIMGATDEGIKVLKGAVGRLRRADPSMSDEESPHGMQRRPSMQVLLNNTMTGKREPTVQCVVQTSSTFAVSEQGGYCTLVQVRAKLFQAFLLSGGSSGRMARGDALVELEFLETVPEDGDEEDDEEAAKDSMMFM